jgi:hypothetical protein
MQVPHVAGAPAVSGPATRRGIASRASRAGMTASRSAPRGCDGRPPRWPPRQPPHGGWARSRGGPRAPPRTGHPDRRSAARPGAWPLPSRHPPGRVATNPPARTRPGSAAGRAPAAAAPGRSQLVPASAAVRAMPRTCSFDHLAARGPPRAGSRPPARCRRPAGCHRQDSSALLTARAAAVTRSLSRRAAPRSESGSSGGGAAAVSAEWRGQVPGSRGEVPVATSALSTQAATPRTSDPSPSAEGPDPARWPPRGGCGGRRPGSPGCRRRRRSPCR